MYNIKILNYVFVLFFLSTLSSFAFNKEDFNKAINHLKCRNCDLTDANFSKLMIQGIDLEQSNLTGADFSNADLSIAKKEKFVLPSNLTRVNLKNANFFKKSTISCTSSLAPSKPATSLNVIFISEFASNSLAFDFPILKICPPPPPALDDILLIINIQIAIIKINGSII